MTNRHAALALLALAAALYLGAAGPWGTATLRATDEYARLRRNRRQTRVKIAALERRDAKLKEAARLASSTNTTARPLTRVRRDVLAALGKAPVSGVRLQIREIGRGDSVKAHISAQGRFIDLVRLAGHVARPETGLILERVMLAPAEPGATLELDVVWIGGGS